MGLYRYDSIFLNPSDRESLHSFSNQNISSKINHTLEQNWPIGTLWSIIWYFSSFVRPFWPHFAIGSAFLQKKNQIRFFEIMRLPILFLIFAGVEQLLFMLVALVSTLVTWVSFLFSNFLYCFSRFTLLFWIRKNFHVELCGPQSLLFSIREINRRTIFIRG